MNEYEEYLREIEEDILRDALAVANAIMTDIYDTIQEQIYCSTLGGD